jgi:hypothetical protein
MISPYYRRQSACEERSRQIVASLAWQMVARDVEQMVTARFLPQQKTVFSRHVHSLLVMKRRVKLFERDGVS